MHAGSRGYGRRANCVKFQSVFFGKQIRSKKTNRAAGWPESLEISAAQERFSSGFPVWRIGRGVAKLSLRIFRHVARRKAKVLRGRIFRRHFIIDLRNCFLINQYSVCFCNSRWSPQIDRFDQQCLLHSPPWKHLEMVRPVNIDGRLHVRPDARRSSRGGRCRETNQADRPEINQSSSQSIEPRSACSDVDGLGVCTGLDRLEYAGRWGRSHQLGPSRRPW